MTGEGYQVNGNPVWQPGNGSVGGALQFDGAGDAIVAAVELNLNVSFSVFAWVRGGNPGEVILSLKGGDNWLAVDENGALRSDLHIRENSEGDLSSETHIVNGAWHRVGLVSKGTVHSLYVDDELVAVKEAKRPLETPTAILHLGANARGRGSWSGAIDEVRIYNRAINF